jgi:hypothetical protein
MPTIFPFHPSSIEAPTFSANLDGDQYNCSVTWNVAAQRYYVNCFNLSGARVFTVALVETPRALTIDQLAWNINRKVVQALLSVEHFFPLGQEVLLTLEGADQPLYNGTFLCLVDGPKTFSYYVGSDPGHAQQFGSVSQLVNLGGGYFNSTLVYRDNAFEVRP